MTTHTVQDRAAWSEPFKDEAAGTTGDGYRLEMRLVTTEESMIM